MITTVTDTELALTAEIDELRAELTALKAQEPVVIRIRKHYPSGPADGNRRIGDWTYIDQGSVQYAKEQIAGADAIEKLYAAAGAAPTDEWKDAVLNALASHAMDAPLTDTPREIVKKLMDMVVTMACDPAINAGAAPVQQEQASFPTKDAELWLTKNKLATHGVLGAAPAAKVPEDAP
jgi:hypothetical protein